jgi:hypothetical protein
MVTSDPSDGLAEPVSEHHLTLGTEFDPRRSLTMSRAQFDVWCERRLLYLAQVQQ